MGHNRWHFSDSFFLFQINAPRYTKQLALEMKVEMLTVNELWCRFMRNSFIEKQD